MTSAGTYRVEAISVGTLPIPGWEAFFGVNDPQFYNLGFFVWHVTDGSRHALIDTGLPTSRNDLAALSKACQAVDPRSRFSDVIGIDDALKRFGLQPEDVDAVLLTQTLTYHSGGLLQSVLPNAAVYLAVAGLLEFLTDAPGHPAADLYFTEQSWSFLRKLAIEGRLHPVEGSVEIWDGLWFEATGGHHPGSAAVKLRTPAGMLGILESAFLERNITEIRPIGIAEDTATARRVMKEYLAACDSVVAIHEPTNAQRFPVLGQQR